MKNSLSDKGLSLSSAQSISNMCNQRVKDISATIASINNISKTVKINGEDFTETAGNPIPSNIEELLMEKAKLSATQAFLMENIKAKDLLIQEAQKEQFVTTKTLQPFEVPSPALSPNVDENWGKNQLSVSEVNEFLEAEAYAAHVGQFIHKDGKLDKLRTELSTLKTLDFIELEVGKKTPVKIAPHHEASDLLALHEKLALIHRKYESKVNYFKAKVKNLVTEQNAKIAKENSALQSAYTEKLQQFHIVRTEYNASAAVERAAFEESRQQKISELSKLKIEVAPQFQEVINIFDSKSK